MADKHQSVTADGAACFLGAEVVSVTADRRQSVFFADDVAWTRWLL